MSSPAGSPAWVCTAGDEFEMPTGYKPSDFLFGEQGPWPSLPREGNPCAIAPQVFADGLHCIDKCEITQWNEKVGNYLIVNFEEFAWDAIDYAADVLGAHLDDEDKKGVLLLVDLWLAAGKRPVLTGDGDWYGKYPALSDDSFTDLIAHGLLSKLMSELDPADEALFQKFLRDPAREYWKSDLTHMRVVRKPLGGEYVAPSIVLMSRSKNPKPGQEYKFGVDAIALFVQSQPGGPYDKLVILTSRDGKSWQLAKYFALQAALVRLNLIDHTMVHFPFDAINAITKSTLPKSNPILQLLRPHLFLSLPVDNSVLEGGYSLLNRASDYPYSPYPAAGEEIRKLFPFYWVGSELEADVREPWALGRDNAFPRFEFKIGPRSIPSKYGTFLDSYYEPIFKFSRAVVSTLKAEDWKTVSFWADHVRSWIPGFPNGQQIQEGDLLAEACATIIWNGAIVHTADHWLMHQMFEKKLPTPYIMRDAPPQSASPGIEPDYRPTVQLIDDVLPTRLCDRMFFGPHNSTLLSDYGYKFEPPLDPLVAQFREALTWVDKSVHQQFPEFGIHLNPADKADGENNCFAAGVQF